MHNEINITNNNNTYEAKARISRVSKDKGDDDDTKKKGADDDDDLGLKKKKKPIDGLDGYKSGDDKDKKWFITFTCETNCSDRGICLNKTCFCQQGNFFLIKALHMKIVHFRIKSSHY